MKVLVATQKPFAPVAVEGIRKIVTEAGYDFALLEKYAGEADLVAAVADADALIVRSDKVTAAVVAAAPKLRIVVRAGAGYDNLDLAACSARGVVAMNTPGQNSNAVAELAIAMMIYMSRGQFTPSTGSEINGRTLGVQAFGNVGRLVARKAEALGMKVLATDPFLSPEQIREGGAEPVESVDELYSRSDYVSVHIPATPQTVGSIGRELIDEAGLEQALEERPDIKYVTDVAPDNYAGLREKFGLRVFATPKKMGAQTAEANINAGLAAARQIVAYFKNGDEKYRLNK